MDIRIEADGDTLTCEPVKRLGESFAAYLGATRAAGARFDKDARCQRAPITSAPQIVKALIDAGFKPKFGDDIAARLEERSAKVAADARESTASLAVHEKRLKREGVSLFPFQGDGIKWLAPRRSGLLADEMGLGKTWQALLALPENGATVVVCPALVKGNWANECAHLRPDLRTTILSGRRSFRWPEPGEVVISNYDILPNPDLYRKKTRDKVTGEMEQVGDVLDDFESVGDAPDGVVIIYDEFQAAKSSKARRSRACVKLNKLVRRAEGRTWGLTGTPMLNHPGELWNVLHALDLANEAFGSWPNYLRLMGGIRGRFGVEWAGNIKSEVPGLLRTVMLRRARREVLPQLPDKTYRTLPVDCVDGKLRTACDKICAALESQGIDLDKVHDWVELTHLRGPTFEEIALVRAALATAKAKPAVDWCNEMEEHGVLPVVFSAHRNVIDLIAKRPGWASITGDTPPPKRTEIVRRFQAGELKGLAGTIAAMGVGITLTASHRVLFVDLAWTPANNSQAEDRVCRIGQEANTCQIDRLIANHRLDERVTELLAKKAEQIAKSVDAATTGVGQAKVDDGTADTERAAELRRQTEREPAAAVTPGKREARRARRTRRQPSSDVERWSAAGLVTLAGLDPDHAKAINGVGFNKYDAEFGHDLAKFVQAGYGLTDPQWSAVTRIAHKYRRQLGPKPSA